MKLLTDENLLLRQRLFGRSSEKKIETAADGQISLFNEAELESTSAGQETETEKITYTRSKAKGKHALDFSGLPTEQIVHELPKGERVCPDCGGVLHMCGHDVLRRELTVVPAQYKVTEHVQTIYSCRHCEATATQTPMVKARVPAPLIKGSGIASPSLVAHIVHQKYTLALPLYRQEQEFQRNHIEISRQTMANWLIYTAKHWIAPIYAAMKAALVSGSILHADETPVQVLREDGKPAESKSYMWLYRTGCDTGRAIVLYDYQPNRKHEHPKTFLKGFSGYLHSDGYDAYHNLPAGITTVGCWEHVRRKFAELLKSLPDYNKPGSLAMRGKEFCDQLFMLEREYEKLPQDDSFFAARFDARQKHSKAIAKSFFDWVGSVYGSIRATPQSAMGRALAYALGERKYLENVFLDGQLELSNNRAERSIRPFAIGRKNWLFSNTPQGASASAMFYSIIETAKENGLKPFEYLKYVLETAPDLDMARNPDAVVRLLPWHAPMAGV
ncbi:IS66 family transposase [Eubacteriales bacterium OttesenSCG-928-N13]|nr:IS66 family transposase [Eubacteriales bacterium OttesenSCG-928-N13]